MVFKMSYNEAMNILHKVTGFDWDDGNARKNVDKHAVSQRRNSFFSMNL